MSLLNTGIHTIFDQAHMPSVLVGCLRICSTCQNTMVCCFINDLYTIIRGFLAGAEDYLKSVDGQLWVQAVIDKSQPPPPFYCVEFKDWADAVYADMGLTQANVTPYNCRAIYIKLIHYMYLCNL